MAWIGVKNLLGPGWFKVCRAGIKISLGFVLGFGVLGRALLEFAVCGNWTESSFGGLRLTIRKTVCVF